MFHKVLHTRGDHVLTLLRVALGVVFFAHGAQLVLGWFGGAGYASSMRVFEHEFGIPPVFAALAILSEFLGGIGLLIGFLTRIAAFGIAVDMAVAVFLVHAPNGFFMNWYGTQRGEGFEFHLLAIGMAVALIARGAGAWSVDREVERTMTGARMHRLDPLPHRG